MITTGWPPGMLQDDCRGLSRWLSNKLDARHIVRKNLMDLTPRTPAQIQRDLEYVERLKSGRTPTPALLPSCITAPQWAMIIEALENVSETYPATREAIQSRWELAQQLRAANP